MSKRLRGACVASATLLLAEFLSSTAGAKPPDLPANSYDDLAPATEAAQVPVSQKPPVMPLADQGATAQPRAATRSKKIRGVTVTAEDAQKIQQGLLREARLMFQIAEQARRDGDLDMAINCYQETHLLAPTSRYGLRAIRRLGEIEAQNAANAVGGTEEQETPETAPNSNPSSVPSSSESAAEANVSATAREMFLIAERCRERGDLEMALNCYNEARLLAPRSAYARQARARLRQMESSHNTIGASEEQETPETTPPSPKPSSQSKAPAAKWELEIVDTNDPSAPAATTKSTSMTRTQPVFVPAPARRLTVQTEETETSGTRPAPVEFQSWLRQTGEVLRSISGIDIDVDVSTAGDVRFKGSVQAAGFAGTVRLDEKGSYVKVPKLGSIPSDREQVFSFYVGGAR